ncbi:hypothetical protein PVMG_06214 [Plasmodium vivax Mauritania I]|uniref:Variable surface protein Vir10 n=1 Tax=Plasmodium vivax Mauritania I TaxID=1035515 RepID=A0A0J9T3J7_PLAVI|nr:hypothetical protein PVMG_06214 [Plasmodium vivax Mauritania I]
MVQFNNYNIGRNVNFTAFFKRLTFIFLTWTCFSYIDMNINEHHKISNKNDFRLLSKHEQPRELRDTPFKDKLPDRSLHKNKRNVTDHISTYSEVQGKASNNFDIYMKGYKDRYMKKKGLSKLDCYCENKVFDKFNHICNITKKLQNDTKRSTRFFLKKYGISLIIFALIPTVGLIIPILFGPGDKKPGILGLCGTSHIDAGKQEHNTTPENCATRWIYEYRELIGNVGYALKIYSFIMITIDILFIIYILIKVIKYEKIKAGKGKMNIKEYCRFCKDIF